MDGKSLEPQEVKLKALHELMPEVFSEGKIDWEKLRATLGEDVNFTNERYVLNWAGKSDAFKVLQTPTTKTLIPVKEESIDFDTTQNIFIEGENLEVLKALQKSYFGKVKMIYIDPPYNTGNDSFIYPDKFAETIAEYERRVGDKDEDGYLTKDGMFRKNSKENGQYHSNWLNMMMPRLYLAKNLLRQDGVIFVSIDDNEVHNLRLLMNEIFGEENFVSNLIWEKRYGRSNDAKLMSTVSEHIILFRKNETLNVLRELRNEKSNEDYSNPDNDPRGVWTSVSFVSQRTRDERPNLGYSIKNPNTGKSFSHPTNSWKYNEEKFLQMLSENRFYWGKNKDQNIPRIKRFLSELSEGMVPVNLWKHIDTGTTDEGTKEVLELVGKNIFTFPKPKRLVKRMIQMTCESEDIVLDFFSGSGTTAHAVMDLNKADGGNRKFICVQMPELCDENSEAYKAGYKTIAEISKERIRRAGKKIETEIEAEITKKEEEIKKLMGEIPTDEAKEKINLLQNQIHDLENQDLGFKVFKLADSNFKQWNTNMGKDLEALKEQIDLFVDPISESATIENMVYEFMLKSGKDLNSSIQHGGSYFLINGNEMALILESISQEVIAEVMSLCPRKVIALDRLFKDNDQLKTNCVLQMKDAGIEFKTV